MSRYLIRRIEDHPAIVLHRRTELEGLEGEAHLERVRWREKPTGRVEPHAIRHVFSMTGAVPSTGWLQASAVGEGSIAIAAVHQVLHE